MPRNKIVKYNAYRQFSNDFSDEVSVGNRDYRDIWTVTPNYMVKQTDSVQLNRLLLIHKINMNKINMGKPIKQKNDE